MGSNLITMPLLNIPTTLDDARRRVYDHVTPAGYELPISRITSALLDPRIVDSVKYRTLRGKMSNANVLRDDLWAQYLQIPHDKRHRRLFPKEYKGSTGELEKSDYAPSIGKEHQEWYRLKNLNDDDKQRIVNVARNLNIGQNKQTRVLSQFLGPHTIGRGYDDRGEYASYYDLWDLAPIGFVGPDQSMGFGKPVPVYDRIYLDDYYGVSEPTHSTWLPEVNVYGGKLKQSGKKNLRPARGKGLLNTIGGEQL